MVTGDNSLPVSAQGPGSEHRRAGPEHPYTATPRLITAAELEGSTRWRSGNWEQAPTDLSPALSLTDSRNDAQTPQTSVTRRTPGRAKIALRCREVNTQTNAMLVDAKQASVQPVIQRRLLAMPNCHSPSVIRGTQQALLVRAVISMSDPAISQDCPYRLRQRRPLPLKRFLTKVSYSFLSFLIVSVFVPLFWKKCTTSLEKMYHRHGKNVPLNIQKCATLMATYRQTRKGRHLP